MTTIRTICAAAASMVCLGTASPALGTIAKTVLTVEGAPACNRFALNAEIERLHKNNPGPSFTLSGPLGQTIEGTVSPDGKSLAWEATVPVNFTIVSGGGKGGHEFEEGFEEDDNKGGGTRSNVFLFGDGTTFDNEESAPDMSEIKRVRFCYGLDEMADAAPLPRCDEIENGPLCPVFDAEDERNGVLVFLDFDAQVFGATSSENQCVCGNVELDDCSEGLPADEEGSCAGGELREIPVLVEAIRNVRDGGPDATTVCTTVDGKRVCKTR